MSDFQCAKCDGCFHDPGGVITDFCGGYGLCEECKAVDVDPRSLALEAAFERAEYLGDDR